MRKRSDLADAIQERCIARMQELGLNAHQVAEKLDGMVSHTHVTDFLARRSTMGSHKLQHVLDALGLAVTSRR